MQNTPDQHSRERRVTLAGITGDLGARIGRALIAQGASVNAIVRPDPEMQATRQGLHSAT